MDTLVWCCWSTWCVVGGASRLSQQYIDFLLDPFFVVRCIGVCRLLIHQATQIGQLQIEMVEICVPAIVQPATGRNLLDPKNQTIDWYRMWWSAYLDFGVSDALRRSCKRLPCTRSRFHNRCMCAFQDERQVAPTELYATYLFLFRDRFQHAKNVSLASLTNVSTSRNIQMQMENT